jgi:hypothetical protein
VKREWYEARAQELLDRALASPDPELAIEQMLDELERHAIGAELVKEREGAILARAIDLMQRTVSAQRATQRAAAETDGIEEELRRERERFRKNARARARYRERRLTEPPRANKRTGMHALAIEIDPAAYRAVKLEAFQRRTTIPKLIGDILRSRTARVGECRATPAPRWRRTGQGRRASQHTRIDVDDDTWQAVHVEALRTGCTVGRWIGRRVEDWAALRDGASPMAE